MFCAFVHQQARDLEHEEWVALGQFHHGAEERSRWRVTDGVGQKLENGMTIEAIERERLPRAMPERGEERWALKRVPGPACADDENASASKPMRDEVKEVKRCMIGCVEIVKHKQDRLVSRRSL
jgi:hypothetical protein